MGRGGRSGKRNKNHQNQVRSKRLKRARDEDGGPPTTPDVEASIVPHNDHPGTGVGDNNPMMNPVILTRLFEVCDLKDLRRFRLVSKGWYHLSLPRWRKDMVLQINLQRYMLQCWVSETERYPLVWEDVSEIMEIEDWRKFRIHPYKSYYLTGIDFKCEDEDGNCPIRKSYRRTYEPDGDFLRVFSTHVANLPKFWKTFGTSMLHVEFDRCRLFCLEIFMQVVFELTPNLESLTINCWESNETGELQSGRDIMPLPVNLQPNLKHLKIHGEYVPMPWQIWFNRCINIKHLHWEPMVDLENVLYMIHALEQLDRKKDNRLEIMHLGIDTTSYLDPFCPITMIERLFQLNLMKFESLNFTFYHCEDMVKRILPQLLHVHGNSLKKLCLDNRSISEIENLTAYENFPFTPLAFTSLTELKLACPNFRFLEQMRNLRVLTIDLRDDEVQTLTGIDSDRFKEMTFPDLIELNFFFDWDSTPNKKVIISKKEMEVLTRMMPNVKRFSAPLTVESLQVVCLTWKDMKSLKIKGYAVEDRGITGNQPCIRDLKYLEELAIENGKNLTDFSVYEGFLQMPYLHNVRLTLSEKISDGAFTALFSRFPGGILDRKISECDVRTRGQRKQYAKMRELNDELKRKGEKWRRDFEIIEYLDWVY